MRNTGARRPLLRFKGRVIGLQAGEHRNQPANRRAALDRGGGA
jgi:hypothetical protein